MVQRKPKLLEESTKSAVHTPNSSEKSTTTTTTESNQSETRDSFYFPGCRKDANCNCEICIESMNATLDLMPQSVHGSSRTNFTDPKRPKFPRSPVSFASPAELLTPESKARITRTAASPLSNSTASTKFEENLARGNRRSKSRISIVRFLLGLTLVCGVEFGFSTIISRVLKVQLSPDMVRILGEKSWQIEPLSAKFVFLENELQAFVGNRVPSCSSDDSLWKINQDGLLLHARCVLYKSMVEEVSIWGWPLQASGILTTEGYSRSLSIVSGTVAEWRSWEATFHIRKGNGSWTQGRWSSSVVQLDSNTWILDYRRSVFLDNAGLVSGMGEFLKMRVTREFERFVKGFWWSSSLSEIKQTDYITGGSIANPT